MNEDIEMKMLNMNDPHFVEDLMEAIGVKPGETISYASPNEGDASPLR